MTDLIVIVKQARNDGVPSIALRGLTTLLTQAAPALWIMQKGDEGQGQAVLIPRRHQHPFTFGGDQSSIAGNV